jgi:hypothetical protein
VKFLYRLLDRLRHRIDLAKQRKRIRNLSPF